MLGMPWVFWFICFVWGLNRTDGASQRRRQSLILCDKFGARRGRPADESMAVGPRSMNFLSLEKILAISKLCYVIKKTTALLALGHPDRRPWLPFSVLDVAPPMKHRPTLCPECPRPLHLPPTHAARGRLHPSRHRRPLPTPAAEQRSIPSLLYEHARRQSSCTHSY
jgi:hypothetical protein